MSIFQFELANLKGKRIISEYDLPAEIFIFDLETTSKKIYDGDLTEIAAIKINGTEVIDKFQTFVKLQSLDRVPSNITFMTGITTEMTKNGLYFLDALKAFYDFIGEGIIAGYNINSFDINYLNYRIIKHQLPIRRLYNKYFDIRLFATKKGLPNLSLETLSEYLDVAPKNMHRALDDCYTTFNVLKKLFLLDDSKENYKAQFDSFDETDFENAANEDLSFQDIYGLKKETFLKNKKALLNSTAEAFHEYIKTVKDTCFKDKRVVISGKFNEFTDKERDFVLDALGCCPKGRSGVSGKTDYLIIGEDVGNTKLSKAEQLGTAIIDKTKFFELIGYTEEKYK